MIEPDWEYNHLYDRGILHLDKDELELLANQIIPVGFEHHHPQELCPVFSAIVKMAVEAGVMDEDDDLVKEFLDDMENYENTEPPQEDLK